MSDTLFDSTKLAAYYLWEHTGCENALNLWYCAEDMACYFEQFNILEKQRVDAILRLGVYDPGYIQFVRHIAYRIYIYTNRTDDTANWYAAERLLANGEWTDALLDMSAIYHKEKTNQSVMNEVRSENVRAYYGEQTFHKA